MTDSSNGRTTTSTLQSPSFRLGLFTVLLVAVLAAVGVLIWLLLTRGLEQSASGDKDGLQRQRESVMSQSEQFMLRMGTFGPDDLDKDGGLPEYRKLVKEVITPKFGTSFEKEAGTAEQLVAQAGLERKAKVFSTGVSTIDDDSATALVAGTFTDAYGKKAAAQEPVPFRMVLKLVKVQGDWLVDDFDPVSAEGQK